MLSNYFRKALYRAAATMLLLTWPGSFFHELAHQLACYLVGHKVLEVKYRTWRDPDGLAGFVVHRGKPGPLRVLVIGAAPLVMGVAVWSASMYVYVVLTADGRITPMKGIVLGAVGLIALNAAYHALPSTRDIENVFRQPFCIFTTLPAYTLAAPIWVLSHQYKLRFCGWTIWEVAVTMSTIFVVYRVTLFGITGAWPL